MTTSTLRIPKTGDIVTLTLFGGVTTGLLAPRTDQHQDTAFMLLHNNPSAKGVIRSTHPDYKYTWRLTFHTAKSLQPWHNRYKPVWPLLEHPPNVRFAKVPHE